MQFCLELQKSFAKTRRYDKPDYAVDSEND